MRLGVVGATGMVGEEFMKIMAERNFPVDELRLFASDRSAGTKIRYQDREWPVQTLATGCFDGLDLVFFSSGDDISRDWAPLAVKAGAFAVDNSAAFRMTENILLCVPEVNGDLLPKKSQPQIIANPNCSTIQLVVALKPLDERFGISDVKVSTYQAVSGAGKAAQGELMDQITTHGTAAVSKPSVFPHPIAFNCLPQIGSFDEQGFCSEEAKIVRETKKILRRSDLKVSAWTVRIPALNSHSETSWITLKKPATRAQIISALKEMPGVVVVDDPKNPSQYPTALSTSGQDPVYVGRIHEDLDSPGTWMLWIVSDNIRKGAALNGIQIAERIFDIK